MLLDRFLSSFFAALQRVFCFQKSESLYNVCFTACRVNCLSIQLGLDEKTHGHRKARSITASGYSLSVHVISLIDDAGQLHRNCDQRTYLSHLRPSFGLSRAGDRGRHRECRKQPGI